MSTPWMQNLIGIQNSGPSSFLKHRRKHIPEVLRHIGASQDFLDGQKTDDDGIATTIWGERVGDGTISQLQQSASPEMALNIPPGLRT